MCIDAQAVEAGGEAVVVALQAVVSCFRQDITRPQVASATGHEPMGSSNHGSALLQQLSTRLHNQQILGEALTEAILELFAAGLETGNCQAQRQGNPSHRVKDYRGEVGAQVNGPNTPRKSVGSLEDNLSINSSDDDGMPASSLEGTADMLEHWQGTSAHSSRPELESSFPEPLCRSTNGADTALPCTEPTYSPSSSGPDCANARCKWSKPISAAPAAAGTCPFSAMLVATRAVAERSSNTSVTNAGDYHAAAREADSSAQCRMDHIMPALPEAQPAADASLSYVEDLGAVGTCNALPAASRGSSLCAASAPLVRLQMAHGLAHMQRFGGSVLRSCMDSGRLAASHTARARARSANGRLCVPVDNRAHMRVRALAHDGSDNEGAVYTSISGSGSDDDTRDSIEDALESARLPPLRCLSELDRNRTFAAVTGTPEGPAPLSVHASFAALRQPSGRSFLPPPVDDQSALPSLFDEFPSMSEALYSHMGSWDGLVAAIDGFYSRMMGDERFKHCYAHVPARSYMTRKLSCFLAFACSGRLPYDARTLWRRHSELIQMYQLTPQDVDMFAKHLRDTLEDVGVHSEVVEMATRLVLQYRDLFHPDVTAEHFEESQEVDVDGTDASEAGAEGSSAGS